MKNDKDELKLYRGGDYKVSDDIVIHSPTIGEICDYGEFEYFSMVNTLCAVGIDLCWQLEEAGIKFDEIRDFTLFSEILCRSFDVEQTKIIFGEILDFSKMKLCQNVETGKNALIQTVEESLPKNKFLRKIAAWFKVKIQKKELCHDIVIDEKVYFSLVRHLRNVHGLKRDDRFAGSARCRQAFIEDAKMEYEAAKRQPKKSILLPLISTMVNIEGFKRNDKDVWDMNLYAFMDSVKRIGKIRNAQLLLQSGYSGFGIDLKKIKNKEDLNYMGELT